VNQQPAPRRARHLMDPDNPRPAPPPPGSRAIEGVQKWVLSILVGTTIFHLSVGLMISAIFVDSSNDAARIGLNVIAGGFGVIAIATAMVIHRKPLPSPWLLLGFVPTVVGLVICYA
jgi:hypothetical protein